MDIHCINICYTTLVINQGHVTKVSDYNVAQPVDQNILILSPSHTDLISYIRVYVVHVVITYQRPRR